MSRYDWTKKIDLARLSPRERVLIVVTAGAVAVFLLLYIYLPSHRQVVAQVQEREQLKHEVMGLEQQLDEAREIAERMITLERTGSSSISGESTTLLMPYRKSLSLVLDEFNRLAKASGVDFLSVKAGEAEEKGELEVQSLLIDLRSSFKGIGRYLQMLDNLPQMVAIQNLKMEADPGDAAFVLVHLYLTVYLERN
jgi:Tfp pilus assembly protein PilO